MPAWQGYHKRSNLFYHMCLVYGDQLFPPSLRLEKASFQEPTAGGKQGWNSVVQPQPSLPCYTLPTEINRDVRVKASSIRRHFFLF